MSYEQFVEKVVDILRNQVKEEVHLSIHTVVKNNGYERKGITFSEEGANISPIIYLEEYYEKFIRGSDVGMLAEQVLDMYYRARLKHHSGEKDVRDYQNVKDRIIYKLVNQDRNKELLKQVPHVKYLDLAVLFYVLVDLDGSSEQIATMLIRNEHLAWWKVTAEEIRGRAESNTERLLPYKFSAAYTIFEEALGVENMDDEERRRKLREQENMYVLTNHIRNGGASAILYPGGLEAIGAYFKENYYILPCSIHEVIIIPESRALPKEEMECMIREVNETQVQAEEILSDHTYYYDRTKKEITI